MKILKRTADFKIETVDFHSRDHSNSNGSLQIPKKTKVFVEQTIRERENATGKHLTCLKHKTMVGPVLNNTLMYVLYMYFCRHL